jgi:hypothetical protein
MNDDIEHYADHTEFALSPTAVEAHVTLDVPPQLVWECAAGLEDPDVVAARFDFTDQKWERLKQWPPFIHAVQAQRAEFDRNGMTFRLKAGLMAEEMMSQMFKQTISNDSTILQKLRVFNSLVDVAGLKPDKKAVDTSVQMAPKFSITINIPQTGGPTPITVDG